MQPLIKKFNEITLADLSVVGGKNSSLGEMFSKLSPDGIKVPDGFATTACSFWYFLDYNEINRSLQQLMEDLDKENFTNLKEIGSKARKLILDASLPYDLKREIVLAYKNLSGENDIAVAVRSSATAEDLPQASFAGQHESFLNIKGEKELLIAVQKCFA